MIYGHISSAGILSVPLLTGAHGKVAYAFNSTLYLQTSKQLLCLTIEALPRGPVNLNCSIAQFTSINPDTRWQIKDGYLSVGNQLLLSTEGLEVWAPEIPVFTPDHLDEKLSTIKSALKIAQPDRTNPLASTINKRLDAGATALKDWLQSPHQKLPVDLKQMIGCGDGFTPAGDDILSGVLIALHYLHLNEERQTLQHWVNKQAPGNTNEASLALLSAAAAGYAVEPVHDLLTEVCSSGYNEARVLQLTDTVTAIGHSSGRHILTGICTSLEYLTNDLQCQRWSRCR